MKARPILFSAPMIRALLEGRKTQTRRIVKNPGKYERIHECAFCCPYGQPGDLLWVKESWAYRLDCDHLNGTQLYERSVREAWYWADGPGKTCRTGCAGAAGRVRSSRFMPRWASRLTLRLTDVRVERLQEISLGDAVAEGVESACVDDLKQCHVTPQMAYRKLWNSINGPGSWEANPWVWALTFDVLKQNVDEVAS